MPMSTNDSSSWIDRLIDVAIPLHLTVLTVLLVQWMRARKSYIEAVEKLPGPSLKDSHAWFSHLKIVLDTVGTVPGYPEEPRVVESIQEIFDQERSKGICRLWWFHPYRVPFAVGSVFVSDPAVMRQLETDPNIVPKLIKDPQLYDLAAALVGDSLITLPNGAKWKHERKVSASAFRQVFLEHTNRIVADLLHKKVFPKWGKGQTVEMQEFGARIASEILGLAAFSYSFGSLEEEQDDESLYVSYQYLLSTIARRSQSPPGIQYLPTHENRVFTQKSKRLNDVIWSIIKERENRVNSAHHEDLLSYMMKRESKMAKEDVFANVRLFLFAGHETTATAIAGGLWELATHPYEQGRLQQEVDTLFENVGNTPSHKDLMQLPYLDAVVKETLRLHSGAGLARKSKEALTVRDSNGNNYSIPAGCQIFYFPGISCRLDRYFDRPNEFDPERFLQKDRTNKASLHLAYTPFSVGARNCVGQPMAIAELKSVFAHVVRHYHLSRSASAVDPVRLLRLTITLHEALIVVNDRQG